MRVVLGGTFDPLHKGHKALFKRAFELGVGDSLIIGLTSDAMAQVGRKRTVTPFDERKTALERFLKTMQKDYPGTKVDIIQIDEVYNKAITQEREADALVVSEGRRHIAEETNKQRKLYGKAPLKIIEVPYVLASDGLPITATRINKGEIDLDGRLLGTVHVAIGTENDVKMRAVRNIFEQVYENVEIKKISVSSGVQPQPWGAETITGARNRAASALEHEPAAHFGVGVEAGLFMEDYSKKSFDVQYCVIQDRGGRVTIGHGAGFYYPDRVIEGVKAGKTIGQVMSKLTMVDDIGKKQGAIGYLTNNILTREALTEQAVLMALVPRLTELYE